MEEREKNIVILGCGWLGQIVGKTLVAKGIRVHGSYRRSEVLEDLTKIGIHGFQLDFNDDLTIPDEVLQRATHVFLFIPPSAAKALSYPELLTRLVAQFPSQVRVLFSSSSGVYPREAGVYNTTFALDPNKPNRLLPAEMALRESVGNQLTIYRLAGLVGPKRHPAYSLSGKRIDNDGTNPINLIHVDDIIAALLLQLEKPNFSGTYNLVSPQHPQKKEYYTRAAAYFGVPPATYGTKPATNRLITGNVIEETTSFQYTHTLDNFDDFLR